MQCHDDPEHTSKSVSELVAKFRFEVLKRSKLKTKVFKNDLTSSMEKIAITV